MTLTKAIDVLKKHNKWRMGDERVKQTDSKELGEAIEIAINLMSQLQKNNTTFININDYPKLA